ncbi:MAG: aminoglycoside phosphotransferase family protein [Verrucomicrobiota bacterium]
MPDTALPILAAQEVAATAGALIDRYDILQNGSTLVVRLSETLVARVVTDTGGARDGTAWFERETKLASHLAAHGAPVIPPHPELPPGPYLQRGFPINFWQFVTRVDATALPVEAGSTLHHCHRLLRDFPGELPFLGILTESMDLLETLARQEKFSPTVTALLQRRLAESIDLLRNFPHQPIHGDAHLGNLMNTTDGLLWTDWEDGFLGPVEWDLASAIWNARLLDADHRTADAILAGYRQAGGDFNPDALRQCLIARAAVMSIWYPVLYPNPSEERQDKLKRRLEWLENPSGI